MNHGEKQLKGKPRGKPWPRGVSGNPAGRPRGAINKLSLAVRDESLAVSRQADNNPASTPEPIKFDPRRGHEHTMHKIGGEWRTIEQDGRVFDRDTGFLLA
jgi:hypothetical protein